MAVQQITVYIRQHRNHNHPNSYYTREAIDSQLLDAGYTQGDIIAAWNALRTAKARRDMPPKSQPAQARLTVSPSSRRGYEHAAFEYMPKKVVSSPIFWSVLVGFIVLSYELPTFFLVISPRDEFGSINFGYAYPGLIAGSVVQLIAIIWGRRTLATNRPVAMGLLIGVLLTVVVLPLCALALGAWYFLSRGGFE